MEPLKLWAQLYEEIANLITTKLPDVQWVDLWHNQVGFLESEHPFPTPAVFLAFRIGKADDLSAKVQDLEVQMDLYYFYETFLDTFQGAFNKVDAIAYLNRLTDIHALLHGTSGETFNECRRVGFAPVDTGSAGNLYRMSFTMNVQDGSAAEVREGAAPGEVLAEKGTAPQSAVPNSGGFVI
jgi:hypothetical protein